MTRITGPTAAVAVAVAVAAVGFASPALADGVSGTYIPNGPGLDSTWTVSSCGPGCVHIADSSGWSADAHPWDGIWRFVVNRPDGTQCNNDGTVPGTVTFKVDPSWRDGTFVTTNQAHCPDAPGYANPQAPGYVHPIYFTLTKL